MNQINKKIKIVFNLTDSIEDQKKVFLINMALDASIKSSLRNNPIYDDQKVNRQNVRLQWKKKLLDHSINIKTDIESYALDVDALKTELMSLMPNGNKVKLSHAQKSLSVFLKYLWCYGYLSTPPACPIDRRILTIAKSVNNNSVTLKNWTMLNDVKEYITILKQLSTKDQEQAGTIAEKELLIWNIGE